MITNLQVDYIDSNNVKIFRLVDDSQYNPKIKNIDCAQISITPPGFNEPRIFNVKPYFNTAFNASILGILKVKSYKDLTDLPDGVYKIKYSVSPAEELSVEYDYFRTVKLRDKFSKIACGLLDKKRDYTVNAFEDIKKDILWIDQLIDASKYKVEICCEEEKGIELYNEASYLLNKYVSCLSC